MNHETEHDFFSKKTIAIAKTIDKKPFYKLAFLTIAFGIGIGLGIALTPVTIQKVNNYYSLQQDKNKIGFDIIKKISPEEFSLFLTYLKRNEAIYNDSIYLIIDSLNQVEKNKITSSDASLAAKQLTDLLTQYKKAIENNITVISTIYNQVQHGSLNDLNKKDMENFLPYYNNFNAKIFTRNVDIEKKMHIWLYDVKNNNKTYNIEQHIYEKIKTYDDLIDLGFSSQPDDVKPLKMK